MAAAAGLGIAVAVAGCAEHSRRDATAASSARADPAPGATLAAAAGSNALATPAAGTGASQADAVGPTVAVTVSDQPTGSPMRAAFLGLSIEYPTLVSYLGNQARRIDPVFVSLVRQLDPGQSPIVRIGGNSTDHTWWPIRGLRTPRGTSFALSGRWLSLARALANRTKGRLLLGINLGAGSRRVGAVEARRLVSGIGSRRIAALEIGNEPDDYPVIVWYRSHGRAFYARPASYGVSSYLRQFRSLRSVLPRTRVAGPALARTQWMPSVLHALLGARPRVGIVTFHRYPLRACEPNPRAGDYPTIPRLLSDSSSAGLAAVVAPYAAAAHAAGRPFRVDELNSVSCTGKFGVSNTFASALWVLDALFNLKAAGVDGVNIHMLPGSAYQAFSVRHSGGRWTASVDPLYYGLLAFARAFPPGARLLQLSAASGPVKAWATRDARGRVRIVLVNNDPSTPVTVRLELPGTQVPLRSQSLTAPAVTATSGVSLDGESFGSSTTTGVLAPDRHPATVESVQGRYNVALPGGSAVLLTR